MLEYAYIKGTKKLVHISNVTNGNSCNCICPQCQDDLTAKNAGEKVSYHFAHRHKEETKACLMTQLHKLAQQYYLELEFVTLPPVDLSYKGEVLRMPERTVKVNHSRLEKKIGDYYADVFLETDVGEIIIEIMVTHKTDEIKESYYRSNKIASIEYDLSRLKNTDIDIALQMLSKNQIRYSWLYEWCRDILIQGHEKKLHQAALELKSRRLKSANSTISRLIKKRYVVLPSIKQELKYELGGMTYSREVDLFNKRNESVDTLTIVKRDEDYILLQGCLKERSIWVAFLLKDNVPDSITQLEGSIVVRVPASEIGGKAEWQWLKHPSNDKKIAFETVKFHTDCHNDFDATQATRYAESEVYRLSDEYVNSEDFYFKSDYGEWKSWMIKHNHFIPTSEKKNPSIPIPLKYLDYSPLWMFNTWYVLVYSAIAEFIDSLPVDIPIKYIEVFYALQRKYGLHPDFLLLEKKAHPIKVERECKRLISRSLTIKDVLSVFEDDMKLNLWERDFVRIGSLQETLSLNDKTKLI